MSFQIMRRIVEMTPLDVNEVDVLGFDFTKSLPANSTIVSAQITCCDSSGTDTSAASRPQGAPQIQAGVVLQQFSSPVAGADYSLRCIATLSPGPHVITLPARLRVLRLSNC